MSIIQAISSVIQKYRRKQAEIDSKVRTRMVAEQKKSAPMIDEYGTSSMRSWKKHSGDYKAGRKIKKEITIEQINELSESQRVILGRWWREHGLVGDLYAEPFDSNEKPHVYGDIYYSRMPPDYDMPSSKSLPLMNIGQMLELLQEPDIEFHLGRRLIRWNIKREGGNTYGSIFTNKDLCDALWEIIKIVL